MSPPFTLEQFLELMARYNTAFWPLMLVAYLLGMISIYYALRPTRNSSKVIFGILALMWLWVGIVFGFLYIRMLDPTATLQAIIFVAQGIILIAAGVFGKGLTIRFKSNVYGVIGGLIVLYAMFGYPTIEYLLGRGYPYILAFGLVPCPTTAYTLGLLLWTERRLPKYVLLIPVLYSLTVFIAITSGIVEDIGLLVAGPVTAILILYRDHAKGGLAEPLPQYQQ